MSNEKANFCSSERGEVNTNATELAKQLRRIAKNSYGATISEAQEVCAAMHDGATLIEQQAERIEALEAKCALFAASLAQQDAIVDELTADRDSWRDQASQRVADWDAMRKERDELKRDKS
jgi:hypothetical protein